MTFHIFNSDGSYTCADHYTQELAKSLSVGAWMYRTDIQIWQKLNFNHSWSVRANEELVPAQLRAKLLLLI